MPPRLLVRELLAPALTCHPSSLTRPARPPPARPRARRRTRSLRRSCLPCRSRILAHRSVRRPPLLSLSYYIHFFFPWVRKWKKYTVALFRALSFSLPLSLVQSADNRVPTPASAASADLHAQHAAPELPAVAEPKAEPKQMEQDFESGAAEAEPKMDVGICS